VVAVLLLSGCRSTSIPFTKSDVRGAQRVAGMSFTDTEIDTLYGNLTRNLENYLDLRKHPLENSVAPALSFDPRPRGFIMPAGPDRVELPLPQNLASPGEEGWAYLSVAELGALLRDRKITSVELTRFFLARLREHDEVLEAVVTVTEDRALEAARLADEEIAAGRWRGPLHGIPYGAKDLLAVPGYPTTWGAGPYRDQIIDHTAAVIRKLDEAGAVLVAKLASGELASGDRWFGGRTRTPWDTDVGASGSSAGPGAATAAGLVPFAIGTETWGSIISPSTRSGLTGLRPTFGRVSRNGVCPGPWTKSGRCVGVRSIARWCSMPLEESIRPIAPRSMRRWSSGGTWIGPSCDSDTSKRTSTQTRQRRGTTPERHSRCFERWACAWTRSHGRVR